MADKKVNSTSTDISILSAGVKIEGRIYSQGNMRIDGQIRGDIVVNGNLTMGDTSDIEGEVKAKNVTVSGKVHGLLTVNEKLILESTSKLVGDLNAKILVVEEGAKFEGNSIMGSN